MKKRDRFGGRGPNAIWLLLLIFFAAIGFLYYYSAVVATREMISYSTFVEQVDAQNVSMVEVEGQQVRGMLKNPIPHLREDGITRSIKDFSVYIATPTNDFMQFLQSHSVNVRIIPIDRNNWNLSFVLIFGLFALMGLVYFFLRQGQGGGGGKMFSFGKSKARFFAPNTIKIKFKDVAGVEEAKDDLKDVVDFLKNPERFRRLGAKIPRGVLLTGAPGNGKTMLAKAVAGEAHCPFFSISGSDFIEVFVGVGASRVRDLFLQARRHAPCIVFIDEIDAVGRSRGVSMGGGNDEREQTLNQLLSEMDGFTTEHGEVIVIAATNRPDVLDKALLRPGRFDRKVEVPYPDLVSREQILKIHCKGVKISPSVDIHKIARGTSQFSGADLANLINEAALLASKKHKKEVEVDDFEEARDKILVGAERRSLTRTKEELLSTAYHEAGHTLVSILLPGAQALHKVTILSRGGTLGTTWYLPEGDEVSRSEDQLIAEIMVCLGGRVAEEHVYGMIHRTTGASSDIKVATGIARRMVSAWGMSELGPISIVSSQEFGQREHSEGLAEKIDAQVSKIINECYAKTQTLLLENRTKLDTLAKTLFEKETMDASEVYELLGLPGREMMRFDQEPTGEQTTLVEPEVSLES